MTSPLGKTLNLVRRGRESARNAPFRLALPVLIFISVALLGLSKLEHRLVEDMRWRIAELVTPALSAALGPLSSFKWAGQHVTDYFSLVEELDRLRDENQRLRGWEWRAKELERKLADLSAVARAVEAKGIPFVTARVVANSSSAFVRSVMINAGREQNIKSGYPVLNGDGLVGRIVETGSTAARVLLLTDQQSRIPVFVGSRNLNAVVAGDNGAMPRLVNLPSDAEIAAGEEVATSGIGGLFPRGLRIGTVTGEKGSYRVQVHANLDTIEYLSVLFYDTPALGLVNGEEGVRGADARGVLGRRSIEGGRR